MRKIALAAGILGVAFAVGLQARVQNPAAGDARTQNPPAGDVTGPSATVPFLVNAVQDSRLEVAVAKLAQERSEDAKVKAYAKTLESDQQNADLQFEAMARTK